MGRVTPFVIFLCTNFVIWYLNTQKWIFDFFTKCNLLYNQNKDKKPYTPFADSFDYMLVMVNGGIPLYPTWSINYVNMQHNYVNMRDNINNTT